MAKKNQHPLDSDRGVTIVEQPVVTSIVSVVTREAEKVQMSSGGTRVPAGDNSPTVGEFFNNLTGGGDFNRGVSVEVDDREAAVDLTMTIPYGESIPQVTQTVRDAIVQRVNELTGMDVTEVNITVADVAISEQ